MEKCLTCSPLVYVLESHLKREHELKTSYLILLDLRVTKYPVEKSLHLLKIYVDQSKISQRKNGSIITN